MEDNLKQREHRYSCKSSHGWKLHTCQTPKAFYLPDEDEVIRARDVTFHGSAKQSHTDDPKVEFEAVIVDPNLEEGGRISYNVPTPKRQPEITNSIETEMKTLKPTQLNF